MLQAALLLHGLFAWGMSQESWIVSLSESVIWLKCNVWSSAPLCAFGRGHDVWRPWHPFAACPEQDKLPQKPRGQWRLEPPDECCKPHESYFNPVSFARAKWQAVELDVATMQPGINTVFPAQQPRRPLRKKDATALWLRKKGGPRPIKWAVSSWLYVPF